MDKKTNKSGASGSRRESSPRSSEPRTPANKFKKGGEDYPPKRSFDADRPKRSYGGDKPDFSDRPKRSFGGDSDRPKRSYGGDKPDFSDRPKRSFGGDSDRPKRSYGGDKPDFSDRPKRTFGEDSDRPKRSYGGDKPDFSDRPKRTFGGDSDRPKRSYGGDKPDFSDRPKRTFGGDSDRPKRSYGGDKTDFSDRPKRTFGEDSDRPKRSYGGDKPDFSDRPKRSFGSDSDRPKRSYGGDKPDFSDRPKRTFGEDSDRPKRSYGGNKPDFSDRPKRTFGSDSDRPKRSYGSDKPDFSDRPKRTFGGDSDRPKRSYGGDKPDFSDRPKRTFGEDSDRPKRSYGGDKLDFSDRPKRNYSDRSNDDRKPRTFSRGDADKTSGEEKKKPFGGSDNFYDKPRRSFGKSDFQSGERSERPNRYADKDSPKTEKKSNSRYADNRVGKFETAPTYNKERMESAVPEKRRKFIKDAENEEIRLNRYIANAGICSRRDADELIASGQIKVNGNVITEMGYKVLPNDAVKYGNKLLNPEKSVYVILNKPKDYITTTEDPDERLTVMDLVADACPQRIYPVGRLDRNTTGLILLTNDGELATKLMHPSNEIRKIYQVELDKPISTEHFEAIQAGIELEDGKIKPDDLAIITPDAQVIGIEIHSGKNRIVRRIFENFGYEVTKLDRTTYAGLTKKDLPRGKWRFLTEKEVIRLKYMI